MAKQNNCMIISVKTIPNSKRLEITKLGENSYRIKLDSPAIEGRANMRLIEVLADYFGTHKSSVTIVKGHIGREKLINIR